MQIGTPEPISTGATNANGWVYGVFELAIVVIPILLLTLPFWGKKVVAWMFRPFGDKRNDDR